MDRSFLSDAKVVSASRDFVCIRLATYEDADEARYLSTIFTRRGALENTVFAILASDGTTRLSRPGRRPSFRGPSEMSRAMSEVISNHDELERSERWDRKTLPELKTLDLAMNVASCDGLPLIVAMGETPEQLAQVRESLLPVAWSEEFGGQFVFASVLTSADLRSLTGLDRPQSGAFIVEPDSFGVAGIVVQRLHRDATRQVRQLRTYLASFTPPNKSHREHVQTGFALGLRWTTEIPVTDAQAVQASNRLWGSSD